MYQPRHVCSLPNNNDGIKRYTISVDGADVGVTDFEQRLAYLKTIKPITPAAFVIFSSR